MICIERIASAFASHWKAQQAGGNIPSKFNGSFRWPLVGRISGEFGCSSYVGYGPGYGCAHFHNGPFSSRTASASAA